MDQDLNVEIINFHEIYTNFQIMQQGLTNKEIINVLSKEIYTKKL